MDDDVNLFYKLDILNFKYSDGHGEIEDYVTGESVSNHDKRFFSNVTINPSREEEILFFQKLIQIPGSLKGKTIGLDYRLINDSTIEILKKAYKNHLILGIRLLPEDVKLSNEIYEKLNNSDFKGLLLSVNDLDGVDLSNSFIDVRRENGYSTFEHIAYDKNGANFDNYNVHITRKLSPNELTMLFCEMFNKPCNQIFLDFYDPVYYEFFVREFSKYKLPSDIKIVLIANPLYDNSDKYRGLHDIISNPIDIKFNTSSELNKMYEESPYTEAIYYHSDIEVDGNMSSNHYANLMKLADEVVKYMEKANFSPLEKIAYVDDYIKKEYQHRLIQRKSGYTWKDIYLGQDIQCEELADIYSVVLRRAGILCFTYGSNTHRKNILRIVDSKYGIDRIAIMDVARDFDKSDNMNSFNNFLVPIDNDLYNKESEIINAPTSLIMSSHDYYEHYKNSNPNDPIKDGVRLLKYMGLGSGDRKFDNDDQEVEFYKSALASSSLTDEIPYYKIVDAFTYVRSHDNRYPTDIDKDNDRRELIQNLQTRGNNYYVVPSIKLIEPPDGKTDVDLYKMLDSNLFDAYFTEMPNIIDKYNEIKDKIEEKNKDKGMKNMKEFEEYVMDNLNVSELVFYRDVKDSGRIFANKSVFRRFHLPTPRYEIEMENGEKIYELNTANAIDILNGANNKYAPYIVRYRMIQLNEYDHDYRKNDEKEKEEKDVQKFIFYRNINDPEKLYVRKEVFDRFHIVPNGDPAIINGIPCYEIGQEDVLYISGNAKNQYAPYQVEEKNVPLNTKAPAKKSINDLPYKDKFIIYRDIDRPTMLYVRKEVFKRFHLDTDVEEVIISGIPCYVLDRGDLNYIVGNANNNYSPYEIEYRDVKLKTTNIKPAENENAKDVFKIFRNTVNRNQWYVDKKTFDRFHLNTEVEEVVISGLHCYAIDEDDLAYIVGNANNKYSPYKVEFIDVAIDSRNMRPGENSKAVETIELYRSSLVRDMFFVRKDVFERFHLDTEVEEIGLNGETYYIIDPEDLEYIIRNANNKYSPYKIQFKDVPLGALTRKVPKRSETARDLVDDSESDYIPGTNVRRPRNRFFNESDEEYAAYLGNYYQEMFGKQEQYRK